MITRKKVTTLVAAGLFGIALVGAGTGAVWQDQVAAGQQITTGSFGIAVYTSDAVGNPIPSGDDGSYTTHTVAGKTHNASVTYTLDNAGSTFSIDRHVTFKNVGTLPATCTGADVSPAGVSDVPLRDRVQTQMGSGAWWMSVAFAEDVAWTCNLTLSPGQTYTMPFSFSGTDLGADVMGQTVTPTMTVSFQEAAGTAARSSSSNEIVPVK